MSKTQNKGVGALDFFCIGFGAIVGVGWAVSINSWMANCGGPIPAAVGYILALVMMVPIALVYCELVPMIPVAGGGMAFAYTAFSPVFALVSGWAAFGAFVSIIPWEAIQITTVLSYLFPGMISGRPLYTLAGTDIYLITIIIGAVFSVLLFMLNMRGMAAAAALQKVLCIVLVGSAIIGAAIALIFGDFSNLGPLYDGTVKRGLSHSSFVGGALSILAAAPFFLAGFETIPQGIEDANGDPKSVGKMVVISVSLSCVFYAILLFCFGCGMPWVKFFRLDSPSAASLFKVMFPGFAGKALYWMITLGSIAGLFTTWNGFFMASANLLMAMGRARLVPSIFSRRDKNNVPRNGLIICLFLSLCGPFLGAGLIDTVTCFSAAAFVLSWMITSYCLIRLRHTRPNAKRPYKIPGGLATGWFAAIVSTVVFVLLFIPHNPVYMGSMASIGFAVWTAVGLLLYLANSRERNAMPREELRASLYGGKELDLGD